jgi:hydrogenase-4 component F
MENMNLALIGFASGGIAGITGALLLLISHSFGKAGAFYSSGNVLKATGKKGIEDINGLWNSMPMTSGSMLLSSLAVTGTPPFGTFFGEFLILYNLLTLHYYIQFVIVLFFLMTAFISVNLNVSKMIFRGESDYSEPDRVMPLISMVSSVMPIVIGIIFLVMTIEMV